LFFVATRHCHHKIAMAATTKKAAKTTKTKEGHYCHQSAAELFRWSDSLYFCNGVRIRYGDHEYYVRLMAAKAMMQRQKPRRLRIMRNSLTAPHHWNMTSRFKTIVAEWTKAANRKRMY
jgi:rhamnogalacturonyl hydrolase YesR